MTNQEIAARLRAHASELEKFDGNLFRVRAFRQTAALVAAWPQPLSQLVADKGPRALEAIPGIGASLAYTLEGLARDGEFRTLSGDDGKTSLDHFLTSVPGVGPRLARRLREELKIATLEQLDEAAHDGRLRQVGVSEKRIHIIQDALAVRIGRVPAPVVVAGEPSVAELLQLDEEFRDRTQRRSGRRSLGRNPLVELERNGWRFRAHWADTSLAHRLHTTRDWVTIEFDNEDHSGERTIVTETRGGLRGQRVVRGRERECQPSGLMNV